MANKYPPIINLDEAIGYIKKIYKTHNSTTDLSKDLLPDILESTKTSSFFSKKITALKNFGLIDTNPNDLISLTSVGAGIAKPSYANEEIENRLISFKKNGLLASLLEKYPGGKLPNSEALKESLVKNFNIDRNQINKWYDFVVGSFKAIQGFTPTSELPKEEKSEEHQKPLNGQSNGENQGSSKNLDFMLRLPSGKVFEYSYDEDSPIQDIEFIIKFFTLIKETSPNKKG